MCVTHAINMQALFFLVELSDFIARLHVLHIAIIFFFSDSLQVTFRDLTMVSCTKTWNSEGIPASLNCQTHVQL